MGVAQRAARPAVQEAVERTVASSSAAQNDGMRNLARVNEVDINAIAPNPDQPRTNFKREAGGAFRSIRKDGLLQPILVRPQGWHVSDHCLASVVGEASKPGRFAASAYSS